MDVQPWQAGVENPRFRQAVADLQARLRRGEERASEAVLSAYPELADAPEEALELIYTEHVLQQESGVEITLEEWVSRFPARSQDLRELFQVHEVLSDHGSGVSHDEPGGRERSRFGTGADHSGERIGNCELLEELGRGGMGIVYRARQMDLDRIVALKTLYEGAAVGGHGMRRFQLEAESAGRLQHPHIVQIYHVGTDHGIPYLTMEFVSGGNLGRLIRERPLRSRTSAQLVECLARAVHYAHSQGIVHRDLKPENVLLAPSSSSAAIYLGDALDGATQYQGIDAGSFEPKIADFGLAKQADNDDPQTLEGGILGTPGYMAPEQTNIQASSSSPACDVYALGAMLYDMLVGRPPFHAATVLETLHQVRHEDPIPPRQIQSAVPRDLETICMKCLHKQPTRRFASAADLADELQRFLDGEPILSRRTGLWERGHKWVRRHPSRAALLLVAIVAVLGVTWQWIRAETNRLAAERHAATVTLARQAESRQHRLATRIQYAHDVQLAHLQFQSNNATQALQLLNACPVELRNWEWNYIRSQCQKEQFTSAPMPKTIRQIDWSHDGKLLAACSGDWGVNEPGRLNVWEVESGRLRFSIEGHPNGILGVRFNRDGTQVATAGTSWHGASAASGVRIWDVADGSLLRKLDSAGAHCLEYSPDGRFLAVGRASGDIALYEAGSDKQMALFQGHTSLVLGLSFRPDGKFMASAGRDGTLRVWDLDQRRQFASVERLIDVRHVQFLANGRDIALGTFAGIAKIYRQSASGVEEAANVSRAGSLPVLRVSPDGQTLAISSLNEPLTLVDLASERILRTLPGHNGYVTAAEFSPQGRLIATGGADGIIKIWDLAVPVEPRRTNLGGPFTTALAFHPDGHQIALAAGPNIGAGLTSRNELIRLWDLREQRIVNTLSGHIDWLTSITFDHAGDRLLTGSFDQTARLWDARTSQCLQVFRGHSQPVTGVTFLDGDVVTASRDGTVRLWRSWDGSERAALSHGTQAVVAVAAGRNGMLVTATENGQMWLWDGPTGTIRGRFQANHPGPAQLAFSFDGRLLAAASKDPQIMLWNTRELIDYFQRSPDTDSAPGRLQLVGHTGPVTGIAFNVDGNRLASTSDDRYIKLWDVETGQEVLSFAGLSHNDSRVAFSPRGDELIQSGNSHISAWGTGSSAAAADPQILVRNWHLTELERAMAAENRIAMRMHLNELRSAQFSDPQQLKWRAMAYSEFGEWDAARADWDRTAQLVFQDLDVWRIAYPQALVRLLQRDAAGYREHCQRLWRIYGHSGPKSHQFILWNFCLGKDCGVPPAEYLAAARRCARDRRYPGSLNTLGACLYRANRIEEAIETLNLSAEQLGNGGVPHDWVFLALCHVSLGNMELATDYLLRVESWLDRQRQRLEAVNVSELPARWTELAEIQLLADEVRQKFRVATPHTATHIGT